MGVASAIGADIELGNFFVGAHGGTLTARAAAAALLDGFDQASARWQGSATARDWGRRYLPATGGCVYIDSDHLEVALPEARDAWSHVASFHAMLRLVRQAQRRVQERLPDGVTLEVLANTSDGLGASYGAHLNFLVARQTFDDVLERKLHHLAWLASYHVSALVLSGQGKAGAEHGRGAERFHLSQRGEFFERLTSIDTMNRRGIVNRRDEAHCGARPDLARLHVIFFDDMLAHVARLVTVGSLQIVLAMLAAGCATPALILESPLDALHAWNADPSLRSTAALIGGRRVTIVELQRLFFAEASRFVERGGCDGLVVRAADIVTQWGAVLDALERQDLDALATRLDWVLKLRMLESAVGGRVRLGWRSPQVKALDHLYASLGDTGLFLATDAAGGIERVVGEEAIVRAMAEPPEDSRAWTRAMLLRRFGPLAVHVNWDRLEFEVSERWSRRRFVVALDHPLRATRQECGQWYDAGADLESAVVEVSELGDAQWPGEGSREPWSRDSGAGPRTHPSPS
jgi:proteasome accessory factor A